MNIKLDDLWNMYRTDIGATKRDFDGLKSYTLIHNQVNDAIVKKLLDKVKELRFRLRGVQNILRTPRLTTMFHKRMMSNVGSFAQHAQAMINEYDLSKEVNENDSQSGPPHRGVKSALTITAHHTT